MERDERDCRAVLDDHLACRERGDLEQDLAQNFDEAVVVLSPTGAFHGRDGARKVAEKLNEAAHRTDGYVYDSIVTAGRVALLEWAAYGEDLQITDGVDTFLVEDGRITVQTIRYTVVSSDLSQTRSIYAKAPQPGSVSPPIGARTSPE